MNEFVAVLHHMAANPQLLGLLLFSATALLVASGMPGVIIPLSFAAGALLGSWLGSMVVIMGTLLGSQVLFLCTRKFAREFVREKFGLIFLRIERELGKRGFVYVASLRLFGPPHGLVTVASAVSPMTGMLFAAATLIGFLPVVVLTAIAGSAV